MDDHNYMHSQFASLSLSSLSLSLPPTATAIPQREVCEAGVT
ncbi:MAG: hypothetical protein U0586_04475 [Candidatus Brocadiaceae bacterium]